MREDQVEIVSDGLAIRGVLHSPEADSWPLVVVCHGLFSSKDGSKYRHLGQAFAARGFACIRFDFRGCGESEGRLEESTVSGRWQDLRNVISRARGLQGFNGNLGLLGSSLGGYLALLEAGRNPLVLCVAVWSAPSRLTGLAERLPAVAPVIMSRAFYQDVDQVQRLIQVENLRRILIIHGEQDQLVPARQAYELFEAVQEPKYLHLLTDGDHRFSRPEIREQAVRHSLDWFSRYLGPTNNR